MNIKKITALTALLGLALAANAADTEIDVDEFTLADTDGSGCVDWEELRNRGMLVFYSLDANHDGIIAGDEHPNAVSLKGDRVSPESVDQTRFQVALKIALDKADTDGNGCLTEREWN